MSGTNKLAATLFAVLCALAAGGARADVVTLRADEWCPFDCSGQPEGYGVEVTKAIFAKAGHRVEFALSPWSRSLEDCLRGEVTAVIGAAPVDSPDLVFPHLPIGVWDTTFLVRRDDPWRFDGVASLSRIKLGGIIGYIYMEPVASYMDANRNRRDRVDLVGGRTPLDVNLRKLLGGRIGATMESRSVLEYKLKEMGLADQVEFAGGTESGPIYVAFSPKHPKSREYARLFDRGLAEMRANGELKAILDRYGVRDWQ